VRRGCPRCSAWPWLTPPRGGSQIPAVAKNALLAATCSEEVTTEHVYLALITPSDEPDDQSEGLSS
jgi:hypothetical protein